MPCLQRIVSITILGLGIHVVPLASPISVIIWVIHCHPSFCRCFHDLRRKHYPLIRLSLSFLLLTPTVSYFRRCRLSTKIYLDRSSTSTWSRVPCWWC